jgi:hypothetical protein
VLTSTSTGTQTPFAPGIVGPTVVRLNNASLLTIATFEAGYDGQQVELVSVGGGQVDINDTAAALGTAAQRIVTGASNTISLSAGLGRLLMEYDATTARWRVLSHEQGQVVSYTPTWTSSGVAPAIVNGTLAGHYLLRGKQVDVYIYLQTGAGTTFGTGAYTFSIPFASTATAIGQAGTAMLFDVSAAAAAAYNVGAVYLPTTTTLTVATNSGQIGAAVPWTWATGGDTMLIRLTYNLP